MRHLIRNAFIVLIVIVLAVWSIIPPETKLRRGKDLAGGTSLLYQVDIRPGDPLDTIDKMIELLKNRVDPQGFLEIAMVKQGNNRIEITMPLPGDAAKKVRAEFEKVLATVASGSLNAEQFELLLSKPAADREADLTKLAGGNAQRLTDLKAAVEAYDKSKAARAAFDAKLPELEKPINEFTRVLADATAKKDPPETIKQIQDALDQANTALSDAAKAPAEASLAFARLRDKVLGSTISQAEVRRVLDLPTKGRPYTDAVTGTQKMIPSPRERAIERLKSGHPGSEAKIDEVIAAWDKYAKQRSTLDDPADLERLLRAAGVLTFRITAQAGEIPDEARLREEIRTRGPRNVRSADVHWYKINKADSWFKTNEEYNSLIADPAGYFRNRGGYVVEEFDGQYYMLCYDTKGRRLTQAEGAWKLDSSRPTPDELGRPAIAFQMDTLGGDKMGQLTSNNLQRQMAVLLDDEIYTAPTIQSKISNRGQITGEFTPDEIRYIVRVLGAGSLAAKLSPEPISRNTIGPDLGVDNLERGLRAGMIAFIAVSAFMIFYYFLAGFVSVVALLINLLLILAAMSLNHAAFSLPGIAGIILTFGMAVDANVLIYERMREEMGHGADLRTSVRLGYQRALSSIVDGHVTILIVCVVLTFTGTPEIKGFAVTMMIGALTTLFTQLFITRWIFSILVEKVRIKRVSMLPIAVPAVQRLFTFNVDWMAWRWLFIGFSIVLTGLCIGAVWNRGADVLDTEFRGGTKITLQFKTVNGQPLTMTRPEAQKRIDELAAQAEKSTDPQEKLLGELSRATVVPVNPQQDGVTSNVFTIKTVLSNSDTVQKAIERAFADKINQLPELRFTGRNEADPRLLPVRPILSADIGEAVDRPGLHLRAPDFIGGAAILLENFERNPTEPYYPTLQSLEARLRDIMNKQDYADALLRQHRIIVLAGTDEAVQSAAVLVRDENISYLADEARWASDIKVPEWKMVVEGFTKASSAASLESFSSAVAQTFVAQAFTAILLSSVAITIYIWIRFASVRYSLAAIATSLHDCVVAVGMIALAEVFVRMAPNLAHSLGILDFKITLDVVAAVLTILGYSLNDTIIVMDRIREKRGKLPFASRAVINRAINDTLSRTIITAGTTMIATLVLYTVAGEAVRPFAFAFVVGILVGTYSSIAVAAPIVWVRKADPTAEDPAAPAALPERSLA